MSGSLNLPHSIPEVVINTVSDLADLNAERDHGDRTTYRRQMYSCAVAGWKDIKDQESTSSKIRKLEERIGNFKAAFIDRWETAKEQLREGASGLLPEHMVEDDDNGSFVLTIYLKWLCTQWLLIHIITVLKSNAIGEKFPAAVLLPLVDAISESHSIYMQRLMVTSRTLLLKQGELRCFV